jgi:hypothetical protein
MTSLSLFVRNERNYLTQAESTGLYGVGLSFWFELENGKESHHMVKVLTILPGWALCCLPKILQTSPTLEVDYTLDRSTL